MKIFGTNYGTRNGSKDLWIPYNKRKPKNNERIYVQFIDGLGQIHLTELVYDKHDWEEEKTLKLIAWFPLPDVYVEAE